MMMSLNSKQPFSMAHASLPEPKYSLSSLHSSSSTMTSNAPSSCSSSRHSNSIISSSGGGSDAMRRVCLPNPPVRILHNHRLKAHFDSPLFLRLMFFSWLHSKSPSTSIFFSSLSNLCIQSALPHVLIFMTWDVACVLFCVSSPPFLGFLFFPPHSGNVLNRRVEREFPADSYVCILFAIAEQYIRGLG